MSTNILIVDDEEENRSMLSRNFRFEGYNVVTAVDGLDALSKLEDNKFDVVVSDIMMPNMNGIELLKEIREQYPMVHVIMITGHVSLENGLAAMRYGADTIIFKPIKDMEVLNNAVKDAVLKLSTWMNILKELHALKPAAGVLK